MLIKVRATQIPLVWDVIKFVADKTNEVEGDKRSFYNQTLLELLNDHAQCFVRLMPDRGIQKLLVTKVLVNPLLGTKQLLIKFLYSFVANPEAWQEDLEFLRGFAKQMECKVITFETKNLRAKKLAERVGFQEAFQTMSLELGD